MSARKATPMNTRRSGTGQSRRRGLMIVAVAAGALALVLVLVTSRSAGASHPQPREMAHAGHVVPHEHYQTHPRVAEVYEQAAAIPGVLDGIYCYCACSEHSGHYSLLDCFASDHGARCDVCLSEASIAFQMSEGGAPLKQIRARIDDLYGR